MTHEYVLSYSSGVLDVCREVAYRMSPSLLCPEKFVWIFYVVEGVTVCMVLYVQNLLCSFWMNSLIFLCMHGHCIFRKYPR